MPAYFDPKYNTMIELLRFDSRRPSAKYGVLIDLLKSKLASVKIVASGPVDRTGAAWGMSPSLSAA
jgi:hypothetical protein